MGEQQIPTGIILLCASGAALVITALASFVLVRLFPWSRSGERKTGNFRVDQSSGTFHVESVTGKGRRKLTVGSAELPLVGGVALLIGVITSAVGTGFWLSLNDPNHWARDQWVQLGIVVLATVGFGLVGFVDDWRKVHRGTGISELQKAAGVVIVSLAAAIGLNRLLDGGLSAKFPYPPYSEFPFLGHVLKDTHFAWIVFFLFITVTVTSATSLATDFTDGMDGLAGGVIISVALALAVVLAGFEHSELLVPCILLLLVVAGATLGYLPFNWPSAWGGRDSTGPKRRARLIMGDTGSLALGGLLALVAIIGRIEFLLIIVGGIFLLEGLSALISARVLVRFYRVALFNERFRAKRGFPHTELPLPFLATPMHHHYDLLGWNRKKLVYGAWLLAALLGMLGVASVIGNFTWERYLARIVGILLLVAIWQAGTITRGFFIGLQPTGAATGGPEQEAPRSLALYYGLPFRLFGYPLYRLRTSVSTTIESFESPVEQLSLWQRMSVFDARALLGYYCFRAGDLADAVRVWSLIPSPNLEVRPQIRDMMAEAKHQIELQEPGAPAQSAPDASGEAGTVVDASEDRPLWSANMWASVAMPPPTSDSQVLPVVRPSEAPTGMLAKPPASQPAEGEAFSAQPELDAGSAAETADRHEAVPAEGDPAVTTEADTDPTAKRLAVRGDRGA